MAGFRVCDDPLKAELAVAYDVPRVALPTFDDSRKFGRYYQRVCRGPNFATRRRSCRLLGKMIREGLTAAAIKTERSRRSALSNDFLISPRVKLCAPGLNRM